MGLAASQARFLQCTARQTNVEYQGQQINNARTILANKSANAYNEMLTLKVPTPPSQADFTTVQYAFKNNGTKYYLTAAQYNDLYNQLKNVTSTTNGYREINDSENKTGKYIYSENAQGQVTIAGEKYYVVFRSEAGSDSSTYPKSLNSNTEAVSNIWLRTSVYDPAQSDNIGKDYNNNAVSFTTEEVVNEAEYEDAYNQYKYEQYLYEQEIQNINAKTSVILQQDKVLELQLKQLDTEQSALKTELEALDKVIGDHVDSEFKTFGG